MAKTLNSLIRKIAPALCGLALLAVSERADADTILVNPSMSTQKINDTIASSKQGEWIKEIYYPGDKIEWTNTKEYGYTYQHQWVGGQGEFYTFLGDRDYVFDDGVIIRSATIEEDSLIYKVLGSIINITE